MTSLSTYIKNCLQDFVNGRAQARRDGQDVAGRAAIDRIAGQLNVEMCDVLSYQADLKQIDDADSPHKAG
jgi:hypothetical protein